MEEPTITLEERGIGIRGRVVPLEGGDLTGFWVKAVLFDGDRALEGSSMIDQRTESWSVYFDLQRRLLEGDRLRLEATLFERDRRLGPINSPINLEREGASP